jgi:endonuclease III
MKNSKEYAQQLQKLYRGLKRAHPKVETTTYDDPIEALIHGIISEHIAESTAQRAMKEFRQTFVDWNDLRVARPEEIVEILQEDTAVSRAAALALTSALRAVFDDLAARPRGATDGSDDRVSPALWDRRSRRGYAGY